MFKEMIGQCMIFPQFLSTTYNFKIACDFATSENVADINIVLKLIIPPRFPLLAVDEAVNQLNLFTRKQQLDESEYEILLPRNTVFRVISVRRRRCTPQRGNTKDVHVVTLDASCPQIKPESISLTKKDINYLNTLMKA